MNEPREQIEIEKQVKAGQAVYTKDNLRFYDLIVLRLSNTLVWKCSTQRQLEHYDKHVTANHLDVGVGTGYYLNKCSFPSPTPRIALSDINQNSLDFASRRIARYRPETFRQNILEPLTTGIAQFDSVGVNYLLHCLPGTIKSKTVVFDHLKSLMNDDAVIFGSTLLQGGVSRGWSAKCLMALYNKKGIFSNRNDDLDGLDFALRQRFRKVSLEVVGCAALFSGRV